MKKALHFIIPGAIVLMVAVFILFKFKMDKIPSNAPDTIGNTSGNLLNGGLFCESEGRIYFANPSDSYKLYSMDSECSDIIKLSEESVRYINAAGDYLYFVKQNGPVSDISSLMLRKDLYGVSRVKNDGTDEASIVTGYSSNLVLSGDTLVFNHLDNESISTVSISTNGKEQSELTSDIISSVCVYDGTVLYAGTDNSHSIYRLDINNSSTSLFLEGNVSDVSMYNNYVFYIDNDNNNVLTCYNIDTGEISAISEDVCTCYNVYENIIYYSNENNLIKTTLSGDYHETIISGQIDSISCTSVYTFFQMNGEDSLYRIFTDGDTTVNTFRIQPK